MHTSNIHTKATELGFDVCGIARARKLEERESGLRRWVDSARHGGLAYMSRNVDKRLDPAMLVDGARSVVICGAGYNRGKICGGTAEVNEVAARIASYALSRDYHLSLKEKMHLLLEFIKEHYPGSGGRVFVDTAPILEKAWAVEAGLGWIGRNSLLVNPRLGSFMMLGTIVTDAELPYDAPFKGPDPDNGRCGSCRTCIDACPAQAIGEDRMIDASRCISALTIESGAGNAGRGSMAGNEKIDLHGWIFGCDSCQNACPYNHRAPESKSPMFEMKPEFAMTREQWLAMDETAFRERFGDTPLERTPWSVLRNRILNI